MALTSHSELEVERQKVLAEAIFAPIMAVDTETNGEDIRDGRGLCIGISVAFRNVKGKLVGSYFPVAHEKDNVSPEIREQLKALLLSREKLIMHNRKFDIPSLATAGIAVPRSISQYCTMIMAHMLNENVPKSLDWLSKNELKKEGKLKGPEWELMFNLYGWSAKFPSSIMHEYATEDALLTLELFEKLYPYFVKAGFDGNQL
jgi:DNA polymerase III epsilon subunit-like protein